MDYSKSLNLPQTAFPMRANLPVKELEILKKWDKMALYEAMLEKNREEESFLMHDGPPYANGRLHDGHILNKLLKDFVVKYKSMTGHYATFLPGWDCHGLPIELKVAEKLGKKKRDMTTEQILDECRSFANKAVDIQREEFKRLGVVADWEHPYKTLTPEYEGEIVHQFANIVESGALYASKKPVHWCPRCQTAIAETEVEHQDHRSPSIYVAFPLNGELSEFPGKKVHFVIWTTTPWTLPANLAISLNDRYTYALLEKDADNIVVVAEDLADSFCAAIGMEKKVLSTVPAMRFEGMSTRHPFMNKDSIIIYGQHVTLEAGTGCVHTAPGHGKDDYEVGLKYGLEPYALVDAYGKLTADVPFWAGLKTTVANPLIVEWLSENGFLLNKTGEELTHSYPCHDRCGRPVIFRATEQWFISMEKTGLKEKVLKELENVSMIPAWGINRITAMIENAPNWCISRQRLWGVPIVAFVCTECGEKIVDAKIAHEVADKISVEGIGVWHREPVESFLPASFVCPNCDSTHLEKEKDILDVWFDSGVSWAAVLNDKKGLRFPADLYLEGSDQHRGWFQSSLKLSVLTTGHAPYKQVLTHGFVVDGKGEKLSKSKGNFTPPEKRINQLGAEIMRLWASAEDYRDDIRISDEIVKSFTISYRKLRNTIRFMFGFIDDFSQDMTVDVAALSSLDRWTLLRWKKLVTKLHTAYENYEFHKVYHSILDFFTIDLSSVYLDVIKDRYVMKADDARRRASQTVIRSILEESILMLAPIISFTAEEAFGHLTGDENDSVFLHEMPKHDALTADESAFLEGWDGLLAIREGVQKQLEALRVEKVIGLSLDAAVTLYADDPAIFVGEEELLESLFIVSGVELSSSSEGLEKLGEELPVWGSVRKAEGEKCPRCWKIRELKDWNEEHTGICKTCHEALS